MAGWKSSTFGCDLLVKWIKNKRTDYTRSEGEEQVSVSTENRSVERDDYDNRRCTNYNDDRKTMQMNNWADSEDMAG